jgi:archaellum component FlaC
MSKDNGHDPATVQMVDILHRIHGELVGVRDELKATNARLDTLHDDVLDLHADLIGVNGRLDVLTERVDKLEAKVEKVGDHIGGVVLDMHDHAARLRRLEETVFKPAAE